MISRICTLVAFLAPFLSFVNGAGMMCEETLYAKRIAGVSGVLVRSWTFPEVGWSVSGYNPQSENYALEPYPFNNPSDNRPVDKYMKLDWIGTWSGGPTLSLPNYISIDYQRKARTYLFITAGYDSTANPALPGWNPEGWARRPHGIAPASFTMGVDKKKYTFGMSTTGFLFWKEGHGVTIPTRNYLKTQLSGGLSTNGHYAILISEVGGNPPKPFAKNAVNGEIAEPGKICPDWLHDEWMVPGFDENDPETRDHEFRTFHPLMDPCFFCSYGHEHGSNAPVLMNLWPRYGYIAWKNGKESESHAGFKDFVLSVGDHLVYFSVHSHLSQNKRFTQRFHTNVIVVKHKNNLNLELVRLGQKADFGPLTAFDDKGRHLGLTPEDEELRKKTSSYPSKRRQVKIDSMHQGIQYEVWVLRPMCSSTRAWREPKVLTKDQQTGLKYLRFYPEEIVQYTNNVGVNREFRSEDWIISKKHCAFDLQGKDKFYTNTKGTELRHGPSASSACQYIRGDTEIKVSGWYETTDTWLGKFEDGKSGHMRNINYGLIGDKN